MLPPFLEGSFFKFALEPKKEKKMKNKTEEYVDPYKNQY